MLPKINRLKKEKEFERIFRKGRVYKEGFLYLKVARNNLKNSRFGFIVGKKFSPKAVIRNKIKRKLRAIVEAKMPEIKKEIDGIIKPMPGLDINNFQKLEDKVDKLFKKAGIIR